MSQDEKIDLLTEKVNQLQLTLDWMIVGMNNSQLLRGKPITIEGIKKCSNGFNEPIVPKSYT